MINEAERRSRPTVGALLSERRLERGLEIVDIARETRIPQRHLNALEQGRHELLPALAYSTGFVRTYARLLGLDADAMVRQYRSERPQQEEGPDRSSGLIEGADETKLPGRAVLFASLAALGLLLAGVIYYATRDQTEPPPAAPVAAAEPRATAPVLSDSAAPPVEETVRPPEPLPGPPLEASPAGAAQPPATTAAAAPAPAPAALPAMPGASGPVVAGVSPVGLVLRANEDSWIKVSDGGPVSLKIGILKAGETYSVPQMPGLKLQTGNAGGIDIIYNGKQLPPLGAKGVIVRNVSLDPAALSAPRQP